ncbi:MAG: pentapeptide repeat-containing protein [Gammaproteobacteria bacterium]|nr:pentapeptide repeat-containing protein [Gammaproteobacteria bacterium]
MMHQYTLKSIDKPARELFTGTFPNLSKAVEAAIAEDVVLDGVDLSNQVLTDANLADGQFNGADFRKTNFSSSRLDRTRCNGANFSGAFLSWSSARYMEAKGACFVDARISSCHYVDCDFTDADLTVGEAEDSVFWNGQMKGARFSAALLASDLSYTRLAGSTLIEGSPHTEFRIDRPDAYLRIAGGKNLPITLLAAKEETLVHYLNNSDTLPPGAKIINNRLAGPGAPTRRRLLVPLKDFLGLLHSHNGLRFSTAEADALGALLRAHAETSISPRA